MCLREQKKENYNLCSSRKCLCSLRSILEVDTRQFFLYCCFYKIKITCHSNLSKIFMKKIQMQIHNQLSLQ